ncbi:hypothetical protein [Vibrio owensii]|uniref:hypothetical protein n=1 Tax=Vibrio owensii TaxID=696485 RepID=UPI002220C33A|nr:hypothetical protein [Vibrio owensii]
MKKTILITALIASCSLSVNALAEEAVSYSLTVSSQGTGFFFESGDSSTELSGTQYQLETKETEKGTEYYFVISDDNVASQPSSWALAGKTASYTEATDACSTLRLNNDNWRLPTSAEVEAAIQNNDAAFLEQMSKVSRGIVPGWTVQSVPNQYQMFVYYKDSQEGDIMPTSDNSSTKYNLCVLN